MNNSIEIYSILLVFDMPIDLPSPNENTEKRKICEKKRFVQFYPFVWSPLILAHFCIANAFHLNAFRCWFFILLASDLGVSVYMLKIYINIFFSICFDIIEFIQSILTFESHNFLRIVKNVSPMKHIWYSDLKKKI